MGVGFSYCSNKIEKQEPYYADAQSTAKMNKAALMDFFDNKFPELDVGDNNVDDNNEDNAIPFCKTFFRKS